MHAQSMRKTSRFAGEAAASLRLATKLVLVEISLPAVLSTWYCVVPLLVVFGMMKML